MKQAYLSVSEPDDSYSDDLEQFLSENPSTFSHTFRQRAKTSSTSTAPAPSSNATIATKNTFKPSDPNPSINFNVFLPPNRNIKTEFKTLLGSGVLHKEEKEPSTYRVNFTAAANYFGKHFSTFRVDNAFYFYNWTSGIYERQSQIDSQAIMKCYFDSFGKNIWQCQFADALYKAFLISAPAKEHLIPVANYLAFQNGLKSSL